MKILRAFLLVIATLIVWLVVRQYLFCPVYTFTENKPFSGDQWYNPYASTDSTQWVKANFHAHVKAWGGISNGHGETEDVWKGYDSLGYKVHAVSNYHNIDETFKDSSIYISAYEHGYSILKTHQLIIGDTKVLWLDYIFPQTLSNKQNILNKLYGEDNVIFTNHPGMRNGYTDRDMRYLTNYHCIEILNPQAISISQWDAALSAGIPVFGTGDDDMHNVFHPREMGRYCTVLNLPEVNRTNIIKALKEGHGYAMIIPQDDTEDHFSRQQRIKNDLPQLKSLTLTEDTLVVEFSKPATSIQFTGQGGKVLNIYNNTAAASYIKKTDDTYIRTTAKFEDGTQIFLNPVYRHKGSPFTTEAGFQYKTASSVFRFILGLILLIIWLRFAVRQLFKSHYRKTKENNRSAAYPVE